MPLRILKSAVLAIAGCWLLGAAGIAFAQVARVVDSKGVSIVERPGQPPRILGAGERLDQRETISVTHDSWVMLEFSDQTRITLRPNTVFRLDTYRESEPGSMLFGLVKGGLRAITGWIGKRNPTAVRIQTATATIGVRGTEFDVRLCEDDCAAEERARPTPPPLFGPVARVAEMNGIVAASLSASSPRLLVPGAAIYEWDGIATGADSYAVLVFRDGSRITVAANSKLAISTYQFDEGKRAGYAVITHLSGIARVQTGAIAKQGPEFYRFITPLGEVRPHGSGWDSAVGALSTVVGAVQDAGGGANQAANDAKKQAEADAKKKAEQDKKKADEAKRKADEAKRLADQAAAEAKKKSDQAAAAAKQKTDQAAAAAKQKADAAASGVTAMAKELMTPPGTDQSSDSQTGSRSDGVVGMVEGMLVLGPLTDRTADEAAVAKQKADQAAAAAKQEADRVAAEAKQKADQAAADAKLKADQAAAAGKAAADANLAAGKANVEKKAAEAGAAAADSAERSVRGVYSTAGAFVDQVGTVIEIGTSTADRGAAAATETLRDVSRRVEETSASVTTTVVANAPKGQTIARGTQDAIDATREKVDETVSSIATRSLDAASGVKESAADAAAAAKQAGAARVPVQASDAAEGVQRKIETGSSVANRQGRAPEKTATATQGSGSPPKPPSPSKPEPPSADEVVGAVKQGAQDAAGAGQGGVDAAKKAADDAKRQAESDARKKKADQDKRRADEAKAKADEAKRLALAAEEAKLKADQAAVLGAVEGASDGARKGGQAADDAKKNADEAKRLADQAAAEAKRKGDQAAAKSKREADQVAAALKQAADDAKRQADADRIPGRVRDVTEAGQSKAETGTTVLTRQGAAQEKTATATQGSGSPPKPPSPSKPEPPSADEVVGAVKQGAQDAASAAQGGVDAAKRAADDAKRQADADARKKADQDKRRADEAKAKADEAKRLANLAAAEAKRNADRTVAEAQRHAQQILAEIRSQMDAAPKPGDAAAAAAELARLSALIAAAIVRNMGDQIYQSAPDGQVVVPRASTLPPIVTLSTLIAEMIVENIAHQLVTWGPVELYVGETPAPPPVVVVSALMLMLIAESIANHPSVTISALILKMIAYSLIDIAERSVPADARDSVKKNIRAMTALAKEAMKEKRRETESGGQQADPGTPGGQRQVLHTWDGSVEVGDPVNSVAVRKDQTIAIASLGGNPIFLREPPSDVVDSKAPRPDRVKVDPDLFSGERKEVAPGLYVWVREGAVSVDREGKTVEVPTGSAAAATKDKVEVLETVPNFMRFDATPRPLQATGITVDTFRAPDGSIFGSCKVR